MTPTASLRHDAGGFTIVEVLIASAIMLIVTGTVFSLVDPGQATYRTQPEVSEMQQNLRIGQNAMYQDLVLAGAGPYLGSGTGPLLGYFSPLLPYRAGTVGNDVSRGVLYRSDAITIMYVPQTTAQATIEKAMPATSSEIDVTAQPGCPVNDPFCGFDVGMRVAIFDDSGSYDTFTITSIQPSPTKLQHRDDNFTKAYQPGAVIAQVASNTYYLKTDNATKTYQLMLYDGYMRDEPLVDNVVDLQFVYFGEPKGPVLLKPVTDTKGPFTTYGPKPPALGVDNTSDPYAAGENCVFRVDGGSGRQVSRLPDLSTATGLVEITAAMLQDGPWCPSATSANRYDADMLRVRRVEARLRVQAPSASLRGPAGTLFKYGGTSTGGARQVPDQEIRFEVTPRNMNVGR